METKKSDIVKLLFCGDFIAQNPQNIKLSADFKKLLKACDIKCLNFEGSLPNKNPITIKGTAVLPQSIFSPAWCEENGFNVISFANNHIGDFGEEALKITKAAFKSALLVGAGNWDEAYKVEVIEINKIQFGFLSVAQCEFGVLNDNWSNKNSLGCAWINHCKVNKIIEKAKHSLDIVIVLAHAGIEYYDVPLPEWRDRYKEMIELGADAIIGSHPHVPQGWELYNGKPIFYSLGNFYFDIESKRRYWNNGLTVILNIDEQRLISFQVINIIKNGNEIIIDESKEIKEHNEGMCHILIDEDGYMKEVNNMCLDLWASYERGFLRALNSEKSSFTIKNVSKYFYSLIKNRKSEYRFILNFIRCESSRFVISRAIKLLTDVRI